MMHHIMIPEENKGGGGKNKLSTVMLIDRVEAANNQLDVFNENLVHLGVRLGVPAHRVVDKGPEMKPKLLEFDEGGEGLLPRMLVQVEKLERVVRELQVRLDEFSSVI